MENKVDWKVGDRVRYLNNVFDDEGVVMGFDTEDEVLVKWDKDGFAFCDPTSTKYSKINSEPTDESAEIKAVTLLLSLGYTLKKGV